MEQLDDKDKEQREYQKMVKNILIYKVGSNKPP